MTTSEGSVLDEKCLSCGRNTAAGTELYASRKRGLDRLASVEGYLCYSCQPGSTSERAEKTIPAGGRYAVVDLPSL